MKKRLADSEWVILKVLWGQPPQTMKQIVKAVREQRADIEWSYKTYHTYLRNMTNKGLLLAEERNLKDKLYSSLVSEADAMVAEGGELTQRRSFFGSVGRLMLAMADNGQLTEQDREELMSLAKRLEKEQSK
jgi:predicted transcriptional regulator